jgi:hypothetical protein
VSSAKKRIFDTVAHTQPTADDAVRRPDVRASRRPEVKASRRPDVETSERVAFTWRLTPEQADQVDTLVLQLRRQLGRTRLTKAEVLLALVELVEADPAVRRELLVRLG